LLALLGNLRRHAELATTLLHQFLEATPSLNPEARFQGHIARAPSPALVLARIVSTSTLTAAIVVHLAGVVAGGGADSGSRAAIAVIGPFAATRVETAADMGVREQGIFVSPRIVSRHSGRTGSQAGQRSQRQPREVTTTQVVVDSHFRLRLSANQDAHAKMS
jgi:hypothetical protein